MNNNLTDSQLERIIECADEVLSALAGTNEDVHRDDSTKMCRLWDDLNDTHAPPEVVRAMARALQEYRKAAPVEINDEMAFAFCRAISDDAVGADEVEDIKTGLCAAFANITTPQLAPAVEAVPVVPEGQLPVTKIKPVADLYGITSPTGSETSFTFDAIEARNFIDGGWSCQEYVELERYQQACAGNSPVIPYGSEDTKRLDWLEAQNKRLNEYYGTSYGWKFDANFQRNAMMLNDSNYPVMNVRQAIDEAIAAAPLQEVK